MLVVAFLAGWYWITGPMYHPGDVRAGIDLAEPLAPPAAAGARWVVAPGIELYHFEEGRGPEVLTVHGGPGYPPLSPWRGGTLLTDRYKLIYYHQRGCGRSSHPVEKLRQPGLYGNLQELQRRLGLPAQIADVERIRRILGREQLVLMGHSFGALEAALYAAEFPEHIRALVLVAPANLAVMPGRDPGLFERVRKRLPPALAGEYENYMREVFDFRRVPARTDTESSAFYARFGKYYAAAGGKAPEGSDATSAGFVPAAAFLGMGRHHDYSVALRRVRMPVLVIHGDDDDQPETSTREFASLFAGAQFVRIAGAGHFLFQDRPDEFARVVSGFLDSVLNPQTQAGPVHPTAR